MKIHNSIKFGIAIAVLVMMINPVAATPADAYGGFISDNRINEGETVYFSGTFHNFNDTLLYLFSFNISFIEKIGDATTRDPERPNISRVYEQGDNTVLINQSFTETISREINFDPGSYDVSIFFTFSQSQGAAQALLETRYAMINQTFVIDGLTEGLQIAQFIGYVLGGIVIFTIGLLVYNAKFKKKY